MEKIYYSHIRNEEGLPVMTVAWSFGTEAIGNFEANGVHFAIAKCAKGDQFSKKIGRGIAKGRLARKAQEWLPATEVPRLKDLKNLLKRNKFFWPHHQDSNITLEEQWRSAIRSFRDPS